MASTAKYRIVPEATWTRMMEEAHTRDIDKGGYYDTRTGCINIWCGPDDAPLNWLLEKVPMSRGVFPEPREVVGTVKGETIGTGHVQLVLEVSPYSRIDYELREGQRSGRLTNLNAREEKRRLMTTPNPDEWAWIKLKTDELLRYAETPKEVPHA